ETERLASARVVIFVYPGETCSDRVGIAQILVLGVDPDIGKGIVARADHPQRDDLRREPKRADLPCMFAKNWLDRDPPVRCNAVDRALPCWGDPEGPLRVGPKRPITAKLQIEQIVEKAIAAETGNLLRVDLVDEGFGGRHRRQL